MFPIWEYRFTPRFYFPNISYKDILEYEFMLSYHMKIPFGQAIDQMEFYEFVWLYERLAKEKQKEQDIINNNKSIGFGKKDLAREMMLNNGLMG